MRRKLCQAVLAVAVICAAGCYPYKDTCACDAPVEQAVPVKPSDDVAPTDKMPSYQREGVTVIDVPNTYAADLKADRDKADANAQGKMSAGLKP